MVRCQISHAFARTIPARTATRPSNKLAVMFASAITHVKERMRLEFERRKGRERAQESDAAHKPQRL